MAAQIKLYKDGLEKIRELNPLLVSYNVEMAEVTGGTFWKAYTPEQVAGTEIFESKIDDVMNMMQIYPPKDLYEKNIRRYALGLGKCYIRVSGTWTTTTYIDFDGITGGNPPEGYRAVLTKEQWNGVLDFVKAVDGRLLISVANCEGNHHANELWNPEQAKLLLDYSKAYGVPVNAVEFTNEPNSYNLSGTPAGYTPKDFGRDQDYFFRFIKENYPEIVTVGPCACFDAIEGTAGPKTTESNMYDAYSTEELLENCKEKAEIFSYHHYYGLSDRASAFNGHHSPESALSESYLGVIDKAMSFYENIRKKYLPEAETWITEAADAGCGGNSWATTCMELIRSADEIGRFSNFTKGILFHNTLAASAYGYLDQKTHLPNPQYWIAYLWKNLVGDVVYDSKEEIREGAHVYVYSRKDGKEGYAYVLINNSKEEDSIVNLPLNAEVYQLSGKALRSTEVLLNGEPIVCTIDGEFPEIKARMVEAGEFILPKASVSFILL